MKTCWLCSGESSLYKAGGVALDQLTSSHFAITDSAYGTTLDVYRCHQCGYQFCADAGDVTAHYIALEDQEYERTRNERSIQAQHLLRSIMHNRKQGSLLDIGAGSGILVEQALRMGFNAQGIEPSAWLTKQAELASIPVINGLFPNALEKNATFDIITLIDVIEHIDTPLALLQNIADHLAPNGLAVIVTPDVSSIAARITGKKWWHYRIAHLSYFNQQTLKLALEKSGLEPVAWHRPTWYFPLDYLVLRLAQYIPFVRGMASLRIMKTIQVPLNLFDSWLVFARKKS